MKLSCFLTAILLHSVLFAAPFSEEPPDFFPICVWLQDPVNAEKFRMLGINTYVALWDGPTEEKMSRLKVAGLKVILEQDEQSLRFKNEKIVIAWMHGDEPDNAQTLPDKSGWGPPIPPAQVIADYEKMRKADPTRPILLNLGQGVAWDQWHGRGERSRHPEDYPEYLKGCDIASFDIYPVAHDNPEVAGKLWFVADGVTRLKKWAGPDRQVWNCIECTRIGEVPRKPTPAEVRAEVWMSLIHGSQGIIYFVHQFKPEFREAALLEDAEMMKAVTELNSQIWALAPILKTPDLPVQVAVTPFPATRVDTVLKRSARTYCLFAVNLKEIETNVQFEMPRMTGKLRIDVLFEKRALEGLDGAFSDHFGPWEVHLYHIRPEE